MRTVSRALWAACALGFGVMGALAGAESGGGVDTGRGGLIELQLFVEQGCDECDRCRREVLPELERRYAGGYRLSELDIAEKTNYLRLAEWLVRLRIRDNVAVLMVVDGREALPGFTAIRDGLDGAMERAIAARLAGETGKGPSAAKPPTPDGLRRHVAGFTLAGVIAAAAVDSINPCMVATLVFFLSVLSVLHIGALRMALVGGAFIAACYLTYYLLGLGLFGGLRMVTSARWFRWVFDAIVVGMLAVFAVLSFMDAVRYRRTGDAGAVRLRLPEGLQQRIHAVIRRGLRTRHLMMGGFGVGVLVTLMESVCTGQVYVPALALMIRSGESAGRCAGYLALYNLIFVMPLAILLGLTCAGVGTPVLVEWSRRNVVISKVLLGLFFTGMAVMMLVLR